MCFIIYIYIYVIIYILGAMIIISLMYCCYLDLSLILVSWIIIII